MPISLLSTKLHIPPARSGLVSRTRLLDRMNEGVNGKLTLISAPAGFGKTTLLGEWIGSLAKPVAWLSLEKADNDPSRFWNYILAALRTIQPDLGKNIFDLQFTSSESQIDAVLTPLINEIAALPDTLLLIVDDYHQIDSPSIQEGMIFLLEHMPSQLHLVIASRADPAWPLAHWRLRDRLMDVRAADLRFTPQEAADFLNHTMKLNLSSQDIIALEERTEGWIAGLQMAALSLQGREDIKEFIEAFTGSNRYIFDYLMEEVLGRQPAEVQEFLLNTSILVCLSAPLCDAVLDRIDSQDMLHKLEKANLFLIPLDDERHWYRYHHLFADLLRRRLEQTEPDAIPGLHRNASQWYSVNDFLSEAIKHSLQSGDFLLVNELVSQNAMAVIDDAELFNVLRLLETIPDQEMTLKPWLGAAYAWVLMYSGRRQTALQRLQSLEETLLVPGQSGNSDSHIRGHIEAIRANIFLKEGKASLAEKVSQRALELLPDTDLMVRGFATKTLGVSLYFSDRMPEAERILYEAVEIYRAAESNHLTLIALCALATIQFALGKLHQAYATVQEALRLADLHRQVKGTQFPAVGYVYNHMSSLLYDFNRIEESLIYARKGVEFCQRWGLADYLVDSYITLAYALSAQGDWDEAWEALRQARHTAMNLSKWEIVRRVEPEEVNFHLRKGELEYASRWLEHWESLARETDRAVEPYTYVTRVHCLIAQGQLGQALDLAKVGYENSIKSKAITNSIKYLICQAIILHLQLLDAKALERLDQALSLAEPEGYIRIFVDRGQPMFELLTQALYQGLSPKYVEKILSAFGTEIKEKITIRPPQKIKLENTESLSEREMEVLCLLEGSMITPEIAKQLYISVGTVRTHIKNIYRKLDVNRRMQAVQRAKELGLI